MLYDRPYMRRMMFNGEIKPFSISLIITLVITFIFVSVFRLFSSEWYNLCFQFFSFKSSDHGISILWRLLTYILLHDGPFHLIMNLLGIFFIGRVLEVEIGKKDFIYLCFFSSVCGCLFWYTFNSPGQYLVGSSSIVMGCLACYCLRNPDNFITLLLFFVLPCRIKPKWILIGVLSDINRTTGMDTVGMLAQLGIMNPFNRKQESEADYLGMIFSSLSGYDIRETVKIWERMKEFNKGKEPPQFMSTHPSSDTRIKQLNEWMNEVILDYPPINLS